MPLKTRLTEAARNGLIALAGKLVCPAAEKAALDAAYKMAAPLVRACVEAVYPPKDMRVCAKYQAASPDHCIKLRLTAGGIEQFDFAKGAAPLVVAKTYHGKIYDADAATTDAVAKWVAAKDAFKAEKDRRIAAYGALARASRYVEDVTAVWPEAAAHLPKKLALVALPADTAARIQSDIAERTTTPTEAA